MKPKVRLFVVVVALWIVAGAFFLGVQVGINHGRRLERLALGLDERPVDRPVVSPTLGP